MFSFAFIIDLLVWLYIWGMVKSAGLTGNVTGLYSAILCAFLITVWPFPAFKKKPEDMNDKGV